MKHRTARSLLLAISVLIGAQAAHAQQQPWPAHAAPRFVATCAGLHKELIAPCRCVIGQVMREFTVEEFTRLTDSGAIQTDSRYRRITTDCGTRARMQP